MTVGELVALLLTFPQDLPVAYKLHSEQKLLEADEPVIEEHCEPRPDGWVQNKRPDKVSIPYLLLPGN